jgi:hypothetical protein
MLEQLWCLTTQFFVSRRTNSDHNEATLVRDRATLVPLEVTSLPDDRKFGVGRPILVLMVQRYIRRCIFRFTVHAMRIHRAALAPAFADALNCRATI